MTDSGVVLFFDQSNPRSSFSDRNDARTTTARLDPRLGTVHLLMPPERLTLDMTAIRDITSEDRERHGGGWLR
jgi:hypothetical protein